MYAVLLDNACISVEVRDTYRLIYDRATCDLMQAIPPGNHGDR